MSTFGECVGSGYCCRQAPCEIGLRLHGPIAPCPSLVYDEEKGRYWCGEVMKDPSLKWPLHIGAGCCSSLNSDRRDMIRLGKPAPRPSSSSHSSGTS